MIVYTGYVKNYRLVKYTERLVTSNKRISVAMVCNVLDTFVFRRLEKISRCGKERAINPRFVTPPFKECRKARKGVSQPLSSDASL